MSNIYKVVEQNGNEREILADQFFVEKHYPNNWILIGPYVEPAPIPPPIITRLAMIDRFANIEYVGILERAKVDAQVQAWLDRFSASNRINLEHSTTKSGIELLVSKSLLTQERADSILNDPIQENEREL